MDFKNGIWPYLEFFLTEEERSSYSKNGYRSRGYKRIYNIFVSQIRSVNRECVKYTKKKRSLYFKLEPAYKEQENEHVRAWRSPEFRTYPDLVNNILGFGKLAFSSTLEFPMLPMPYYHTGVILPRCLVGMALWS